MGKWTGLLYDTGKDLEDKEGIRRSVQEGKTMQEVKTEGKTTQEVKIKGKTTQEVKTEGKTTQPALLICQMKPY